MIYKININGFEFSSSIEDCELNEITQTIKLPSGEITHFELIGFDYDKLTITIV